MNVSPSFLVSMSLRIHYKRGVITRGVMATWRDYLTSYGNQLALDEDQIDGMKQGLEFSKKIGLSLDLALSVVQIQDTVVSTIRYFDNLRLVTE